MSSVTALDRKNQSTSAEPERGRSGRSKQESKGMQAKADESPQVVTMPRKGKATKAKQEFIAYNEAKHIIWAVPVSLTLCCFAGRLMHIVVPTMREPSRWLFWPSVPY